VDTGNRYECNRSVKLKKNIIEGIFITISMKIKKITRNEKLSKLDNVKKDLIRTV